MSTDPLLSSCEGAATVKSPPEECHPTDGLKRDGNAETTKPETTDGDKTVNSQTDSINEKKGGEDKKEEEEEKDIILETTTHGVFSLTREIRQRPKKFELSEVLPFQALYTRWMKRLLLLPYAYRFFMECFWTSPLLMGIFLLARLWESLRAAINLFLTDRLLKTIQNGITTSSIDGKALAEVFILRLLSVALESFVSFKSDELRQICCRKIRYLTLGRMIQTNLKFDFPAYQESEYISRMEKYYRQYLYCDDIWNQFERLVQIFSDVTGVFSQLSFLYYLLRTQPGGLWFVLVAMVQPLSNKQFLFLPGTQIAACIWDSNPYYRRIQAVLRCIRAGSHRLEIISFGMKDYFLKEWSRAVEGLGDIPEVPPDPEYGIDASFLRSFRRDIMSHLPMMFYSYQVYLNPKAFSLTSIALVEQATSMIENIIDGIFGGRYYDPIDFEWMKSLYEGATDSTVLKEGDMTYPPKETESSKGMDVKFENVSFAYSKGKEPVLKDISFTIKKGQTVVIVGVNGSGKSTLLKLINRIYDVSSGTVYVDGNPLKSYISSTVQRAMAILFQHFSHFPLSFAENIFLGCTDFQPDSSKQNAHFSDINDEKTRQAIMQAAESCGAKEIIDKHSAGLDTVLRPLSARDYTHYETASNKLKTFIKGLNNAAVDMSAGQWQRLALSRLFYRAAMKHIKLVAADEPSASLDPQIEYQIFARLYELSAELGKTLVYVTHRFGYLTKRADLILVLKDGRLVEQGRHADLLALDGEYAKLYRVQAEAFLSDPKETTPSTPEHDTRSIDGSEEI